MKEVYSGSQPTIRPAVPTDSCDPVLYRLMNDCWQENPEERPTFEQARMRIKPLVKHYTGNLLDNIVKRMEKYTKTLEYAVDERTAAFLEEKRKSEELLNQLLPKYVELFRGVVSMNMDWYSLMECSNSQASCGKVDTRRSTRPGKLSLRFNLSQVVHCERTVSNFA